jgi:hypothetical protein
MTEIYTLSFSVFDQVSENALDNTFGPFLFRSREGSVNRLFEFVRNNIMQSFRVQLISEAGQLDVDFDGLCDISGMSISDENLDVFFDRLSADEKESLNDWLFEILNNEPTCAEYSIDCVELQD